MVAFTATFAKIANHAIFQSFSLKLPTLRKQNAEYKNLVPGFQVGVELFFSGSQRRSGGVLMVSNNGIHQIPSAAEQIAHILFTDLVLSASTTILSMSPSVI